MSPEPRARLLVCKTEDILGGNSERPRKRQFPFFFCFVFLSIIKAPMEKYPLAVLERCTWPPELVSDILGNAVP